MNSTLEISYELAEQVVPCLEGRLAYCEEERAKYDAEISKLKTSLSELRAKLQGSELPLANGETHRQRKPKGYGAQVIESLLASLPPEQSLSIGEIEKRTSINRSVIYKSLTDPKKNNGRFVADGSNWKLKR